MATVLENVSSTLNENYKVRSDSFVGTASAVKNVFDNKLVNLNGQFYEKNADGTQGQYVANFSGTMYDNKMVYTTSQMTREQYAEVMAVIGDIEAQIINEE